MKKYFKLMSVLSGLRVLSTLCVVGVMSFGGVGCSRSDNSESGQGATVSFRVSPIVDLQGRAGVAGANSGRVADRLPELTDFAVRVVNPAGEVLRSWASADEVPETLSFGDGSFKLIAEYTGGQVLPNRGTPYYYGETKFKVSGGVVSSSSQSAGSDADARSRAGARAGAGVSEIVVEPAMAAVRVDVEFDGSFGDEYSAYSVDIKTVGDEFVTFVGADSGVSGADGIVGGGAGSGYLAPGGIKLRFHVVKHGESEVLTYTSRDVITAAAREHHTLRLKVNVVGGKVGFSFTTDESTNDVVVDVDNVPNWVLPKAAPSAVLNGFVSGGAVITTEGQGRNASVAFRAVGGLTSMVLRTNGNGFVNGELPESVDLVTADETVKGQLRAAGLVWSEDKVYVGSRDVVYVDFSGVIRRLSAVAVDGGGIVTAVQNFDVEVVDKYDQRNEACDFRVQVEPPVYGIVDLTDGVLFAKRAYFDLSYENEVGMVPFMEYREVGSDEWRRVDVPAGGARAPFSASGASGVSGAVGRIGEVGNVTYCITGLRAETKYEFRSGIASLGYAAGHVSGDVFWYTSESELQIPNAGMEDWDSYWAVEAILVSHDIPYFDANAKGGAKWWATNNDRTTSFRNSSLSYGYNSFPAVSMTRDKRSGNYAAEIRTTSASNIDALNTTTISQTHSQVPGMLYSGTFTYNKPNDDIREGRPFGARPSKVRFWYKFEEYSGESWEARVEVRAEGGVVVGRGVLTGKANVGTYTMGEVDVLYSGVRRRATDIVISFRSSAVNYPAVRPAVRKVTRDIVIPMKESYGKNWGIFVGTVLKVDDVELVYE